jgi:hypothetical protein
MTVLLVPVVYVQLPDPVPVFTVYFLPLLQPTETVLVLGRLTLFAEPELPNRQSNAIETIANRNMKLPFPGARPSLCKRDQRKLVAPDQLRKRSNVSAITARSKALRPRGRDRAELPGSLDCSYAAALRCRPQTQLAENGPMKRLALALLVVAFSTGGALAQSCATKAVSKDGKPLAGAARTSAIKKCCETAAVSKDGKALSGAAKNSFVKKCVSEG